MTEKTLVGLYEPITDIFVRVNGYRVLVRGIINVTAYDNDTVTYRVYDSMERTMPREEFIKKTKKI